MIQIFISIFWRQFVQHLCFTFFSVILPNYKKLNWFHFLYWCSAALQISPKHLLCLVGQTLRFLGEYRFRSSLYKKGVLKNFKKFSGKNRVGASFMIKLQARGLQLYQKRYSTSSTTVIVLRILQKFQEYLFCGTTGNGCFCILPD